MAGHSKWANIKHRKGVQDARRGKVFTKLIREITVAARMGGGGDPKQNPRLRAVVSKALEANMTRDTIERAIQRGIGNLDGAQYEEIRYEGYGPGGAALIVECQTDNRTRTVGEVRHAFAKYGGNLGQDGSVAYLFQRVGVLTYAPGSHEDRILEAALEAGADDVQAQDDGSIEVLTSPDRFLVVSEAMDKSGLKPDHAELMQRAANSVVLDGDNAERMQKLIDFLEDLDDVQQVFSNADLPDTGSAPHAH